MRALFSGSLPVAPAIAAGWLLAKQHLLVGVCLALAALCWATVQRVNHYRRINQQFEGLMKTLLSFADSLDLNREKEANEE